MIRGEIMCHSVIISNNTYMILLIASGINMCFIGLMIGIVEFLITAIEIVAIVILISLGNRRHWPLLCLDNKLDRQSFIFRVLPFFICLLSALKIGNAELFDGYY